MTIWHTYNVATVSLVVPERPGVYAIERGGTVLYVGKSIALRDRLLDHLNERDNQLLMLALASSSLARFTYAEAPAALLSLVEREWIEALRPTCNLRAA